MAELGLGVPELLEYQHDRYIVPLQGALAFVQGLQPVVPRTQIQERAASAVTRLRSQLLAVITLAKTPGVDGTELEVLARPMVEAGITGGWLEADESRAKDLWDKDIAEFQKFLQRFVNAANGRAGSQIEGRNGGGVPSLEVRAREAGPGYSFAYDLMYSRLSGPTHLHDSVFRQTQPGAIATANALEAAACGTYLILRWASRILGLPGAEEPLVALARAIAPGERP